jgi:hypothetical protein
MTAVRRHRVLVRVMFVLAVVVGFGAMFSLWANRQALNTDNWVNTSDKLLENKNIRTALGAYMVDQLFSNVDVQGLLQQRLPAQAQALAGPATAGLRQLADQRAPVFLGRPRVQGAWETANRVAHKQLLAVINGGGAVLSTTNGNVVLNLRTLIDQLAGQLGVQSQVNAARTKLQGSAGAQARSTAQQKLGVTLPASAGQLTIMKSKQLGTVQDVAKGIRHLAFWLTVLMILLFALAVWLAQGWRRQALRTTGWCFVGLGIVVLIGRRYVGNHVVDSLVSGDTVKAAAHDAWNIGTSLLYAIAIAAVAYGVLFVLSAWLAGPTRLATGTRRALAPSLKYHLVGAYGTVAFVFLLVILWGPTAATRKPIGIALFAALIVLGMEVLRRQVAREHPDVQRGETGKRLSDWWSDRRDRRHAASAAVNGGPGASVRDRFDELDRLGTLHDKGVLTDEEFTAQKGEILQHG